MNTLALFVLASMVAADVYSSHHYGPEAIPLGFYNSYLTNTHLSALHSQSHGQDYGESYGYSGDEEHSSSHGDFRYHGPTAIPHVLHNGHIADTHDVAAAKAEHFAAVAKAKANEKHGQDYIERYAGGYGEHFGANYEHIYKASPYHGPLAKPVVLKSGFLADTHEVAAAKGAHLAVLAKQSHGFGESYGYSSDDEHSSSHGNLRYHGPTAIPHVLHDGHIADTHEVAAAKSAHLAALATQSYGHGYGKNYGYSSDDEHSSSHGDLRYHGPTAIPHVLHDGHIADTHEVAAAKAEHFAAIAKAKVHAGYSQDHIGRYVGAYERNSGSYQGNLHYVAPYHGPLAKPVLLKSGYLADTHEVAVSKQHHLQYLHSRHTGYYH